MTFTYNGVYVEIGARPERVEEVYYPHMMTAYILLDGRAIAWYTDAQVARGDEMLLDWDEVTRATS